jgi:hypothetical protein
MDAISALSAGLGLEIRRGRNGFPVGRQTHSKLLNPQLPYWDNSMDSSQKNVNAL